MYDYNYLIENCPPSIAQSKLERNTEYGLDIIMNKSVIDSDILLKFHGFYTRMYSSHYWISKIKFKISGELYILMKKNARNTKGKIVSAAWKLFYQQGYDNTTIEEIVEASGTSRGSFYHYFEGKDALLSSLS